MKRIVLCADDYGQSEAISSAIVELISQGKLSATTCMTNMPAFQESALALKPWLDQVDIGLHFNLTEGKLFSKEFLTQKKYTFPKLVIGAHLRQLSVELIKKELHQQLDTFEKAFNQLPDFIDGHQYIHHLPQVREGLLAVYQERLQAHRPYIRCATTSSLLSLLKSPGTVKRLLLQLIAQQTLEKQIDFYNIPHNHSFSGIYSFSKASTYARLFPMFLDAVEDKGIIVCHPGKECHDNSDPLHNSRPYEYHYLLSQSFLNDCITHATTLHRFRESTLHD